LLEVVNFVKIHYMKEKSSTIWLVIFLSALVLGLAGLVGYNKHRQVVGLLTEEIEQLNKEVKTIQTDKHIKVEQLEKTVVLLESSLSAKPSSTPSASPFSQDSGLKIKTATPSQSQKDQPEKEEK